MIPGVKTAHTPKFLNANIPKLFIPPVRLTNTEEGKPSTPTNILHNPDPPLTPKKNK